MIKLYNTLTNQKEEFVPFHPGKVSLYTCGPTVYGYQHIGNYKSFMTADVLRRYFEFHKYEVKHIQNITDVGHLTDDDLNQGDSGEDKILKKAKAENTSPEEIALFFENYHTEKSNELGMRVPHYTPRATAHIPHMIKMISELIQKGHAYEANGNVFYKVDSFEGYGKLSGNTLENLQVGARLDEPHNDKQNQWDFALWLKAPDNHLMQWDSPWGHGYPGWHIECSAMATEYLGDTIDIHTGGEDHIFPHHEAEIAQTEGVTGKPFANFWVHTRHMMIEGKKMSKSKGTLLTVEDIKAKGFTTMDLRMVYLLSHYRSQMNFTWDSLEQAKSNRQGLERFYRRLQNYSVLDGMSRSDSLIDAERGFMDAMNDDLNTPEALSRILQLITVLNQAMDEDEDIPREATLVFFQRTVIDVFGISFGNSKYSIPQEVVSLAQERLQARESKNFSESDRLRDEIASAGYTIEDTPDGYTLNEK